jgi:Helix-turn-helix domain
VSVEAMTWVFKYSKAKLGARLVLLCLADYSWPDGTRAFPGVDTITRATQMTRRPVQTALRKLEADGMIAVDGVGPKKTVSYRILMGGGADTAGALLTTGGGAVDDTQGGAVTTPNPLGIDPPVNPPSDFGEIDKLYAHWYDNHLTNRPGAHPVAQGPLRLLLAKALKQAPLETCIAAVDGAFQLWAEKGQLKGRGIAAVFGTGPKTGSLPDRIDYFAGLSGGGHSSDLHIPLDVYTIRRDLRNAIANPESKHFRERKADWTAQLAAKGYAVVYEGKKIGFVRLADA